MSHIVKTLSLLVYTLHVSGCFWYATTSANSNYSLDNWVYGAGLLDASMFSKYLASLYWATVTCTTVGYGDITPTNNMELIWAMSIIVIGVSLFSYQLSDLSSNFADMLSKKHKFAKQLDLFDTMIKQFEINPLSIMEIKEYFIDKAKQKSYDKNQEILSVISHLPSTLGAQLSHVLF